MEFAGTVFEAELLERRTPGIGTVVAAHLRGEEPSTVDLIVRRKVDGVELFRTPADLGSPAALLATVQADLLQMSTEEFVAEWKPPEGL